MARLLLLTDRSADFQARRAFESLQKSLAGEYELERCDLGPGLAGAIAHWRWRRTQPAFDLTIAIGLPALAAASLHVGGPTLFSFASFPSLAQLGWLRAAMHYREIHLLCPTETARRFAVEHGVPIGRAHLVRPGVDFSRVKRRRDPNLRQALGLAEGDFAFLLPGDATARANFRTAVWATSIPNVIAPKYRLLITGAGDRADGLLDFAAKLNQPGMVVHAARRLRRPVDVDDLLPATDGVLITATGPVPVLPIATCMAAGLPIVSTVTPEISELLEDRHTALFVTQPTPRAIAQRLLDLAADSRLQWSISDMAKTEAFSYFAQSRFVEQTRAILRQLLAGQAVAVPEPAASAGLRFHGLA